MSLHLNKFPGSYTVKAPKKNAGEHFPNLEMISDLLRPKGDENVSDLVEELPGLFY